MTEPLTHIARTSLPWRTADKTICGHPVNQYANGLVVHLADAQVMQRRLGTQRFALAICMTCAHNVGNWAEWDTDPLRRMQREVSGGGYGKIEPVIVYELRAVAALIAAHRDEFDDIVRSYTDGDIVTMQDRRIRRRS